MTPFLRLHRWIVVTVRLGTGGVRADSKSDYDFYDPDFIIQVAKK